MPRWIGITIGVCLFLGGCTLVALNGYATWLQGGSWAVSEAGKIIASSTAVTIEVVGVVMIGFAGGAAWSAGRRGLGVTLTVIMLISGIAVVNSIASFQATERLSASRTRGAHIERIADADALAKKSADATLKAATSSRYRSARKDYLAANQDAIKAFRDAPVSVQIAPDAGAEMWAATFDLAAERVQMLQAAAQSIWQVVLSMVCFHFSGLFLNPFGWMKSSDRRKIAGSTEGSGGKDKSEPETVAPKGETVVDFPARVPAPAQLQTSVNSPPPVSGGPPRVTAPASVPSSLKSSKREKRIFREWFASQPDGASWNTVEALAYDSGVSTATVSRVTRDLDGTKLHRLRIGRTVQITKSAKRPVWKNGGAIHAFG